MSQTARDTISRAMRMLGVIKAGDVPTANEAADCLTALNAMMHGWKGQGVDIGHIDLDLSDTLTLADEFLNGTTALLAIELSSEFETPVPPAVASAASNGWAALQAKYIQNDEKKDLRVETGLRRLSANGRAYPR